MLNLVSIQQELWALVGLKDSSFEYCQTNLI